MEYTYTDKKLVFGERAESIKCEIQKRKMDRAYREGTLTNNVYDGKTPFIDAFESMPEESYAVVLATGIVQSWLVSPVTIHPGEVIVGENRPTRRFVEHFSKGITDQRWIMGKTAAMANDELYHSMAEDIDKRAKKVWNRMFYANLSELDKAETEFFGGKNPGGLWGPGGYQGHTVPNYNKLLTLGLDGTLEEIDKYDANTNDEKKHELYRAMRIIVKGLSKFAMQYSDKACELAKESKDPSDKERLMNISENCKKVAHDAPVTFYEAVQLCWFYNLWDWVDSLGRCDQYLYPYYHNVESTDFREEIVENYIMKTWEHGVHGITLGGVVPENGETAVNELTYLILQCVRTIHDTHPRLSLRVNENTPDDVMRLACTMWSEGMSDPTLASDTLIIDGLRRYGVTLRDARDYTLLGCQEIEIPGKSNFGCEDGSFNIAKVLEYTINGGCDAENGNKFVPNGKRLSEYTSVEEIWQDFKVNIEYLVGPFCKLCDMGQEVRDKNLAKLVKSIYTDDCIARGVNLDAGGAVYNYGVVETAGLAVVADSFTALEKLVFADKTVDAGELEAALKTDFVGYDVMRSKLLDAPKFGNDDDIADTWATRVLEMFWEEVGKYKSIRGGRYMGACSLLTGGIEYGYGTAALPDGHRRGDPLGNTMGPRPGADKNGITSMLKSVSKLPLHLGLGGTTLNALVPCSENATEENKDKIIALFRTFLSMGGQLVQITTASKEVMLEAQKDPEAHRDLIVRVGGFSCPFVELGKTAQEEIISRYS